MGMMFCIACQKASLELVDVFKAKTWLVVKYRLSAMMQKVPLMSAEILGNQKQAII
jgi:hypothetical protein